MAYLELNALSTILCGSFSAKLYLPEMDKLLIDDDKHEKKYPVLWLIHSEGGTALDWNKTMAEHCAAEYGIVIIAPDAQHTICTNMDYGPKNENFLATELLGICRNNLPISEDLAFNWIGGVGTGAYGAVKAAIKHPDVFSKCIAMDGIYDMEKICKKAMSGEPTDIFHKEESLKAVFGDITEIAGSEHDVYALAQNCNAGKFYITGKKESKYAEERVRLVKALKDKAEYVETNGEVMDFSEPLVFKKAVEWLCNK
ncbi:MAG: prolyl oligopeptidase family serine peptidase [Herbinix sp.]|jgi:S-formylglutathione hydrolase FrmB|nr:prolyl oligopeptidase family serine peptidase [Herbinix sp.]